MEEVETEYGYIQSFPSGTIYHYNHNDELHNPNGPAVEYPDGSKKYFINGEPHRADGPALEWADRSKLYYIDGELHRTDGPAYEDEDGDKLYCKHGKLHRTDGPAYIMHGYKLHFINGKYVWKR